HYHTSIEHDHRKVNALLTRYPYGLTCPGRNVHERDGNLRITPALSQLHLITTRCDIRYHFFFQAEDGIRDWSVTRVQTCALPIFRRGQLRFPLGRGARERALRPPARRVHRRDRGSQGPLRGG